MAGKQSLRLIIGCIARRTQCYLECKSLVDKGVRIFRRIMIPEYNNYSPHQYLQKGTMVPEHCSLLGNITKAQRIAAPTSPCHEQHVGSVDQEDDKRGRALFHAYRARNATLCSLLFLSVRFVRNFVICNYQCHYRETTKAPYMFSFHGF